jgi:putative transposase
VAPSGYYDWLQQPTSSRAQEDARLLRLFERHSSRVTGSTERLASSSICVKPEKPTASIVSAARCAKPICARVAWVTDITDVRTWQGWLYLALVMDLFFRMIAGRPRRTLIHPDQGTQYGSDAWRRFCRSNRFEPSMSRKAIAGTMPLPNRSSAV